MLKSLRTLNARDDGGKNLQFGLLDCEERERERGIATS
jgi:hypothetical protein